MQRPARAQGLGDIEMGAGEGEVEFFKPGYQQGKIAGDVVSFKAVPYAAPPLGALRWREPQPVKPWAGIRNALEFGAPCAQANLEWNKSTAAKSSEDCLTLNVWSPVKRDKALPVRFCGSRWIVHASSFIYCRMMALSPPRPSAWLSPGPISMWRAAPSSAALRAASAMAASWSSAPGTR